MSWRRALVLWVTILAAAGAASGTQAACWYRGVIYAQSTITGEFRESSLVIKGTVVETHDIYPISDEVAAKNDLFNLAVARIRVDEVYKASPAARCC